MPDLVRHLGRFTTESPSARPFSAVPFPHFLVAHPLALPLRFVFRIICLCGWCCPLLLRRRDRCSTPPAPSCPLPPSSAPRGSRLSIAGIGNGMLNNSCIHMGIGVTGRLVLNRVYFERRNRSVVASSSARVAAPSTSSSTARTCAAGMLLLLSMVLWWLWLWWWLLRRRLWVLRDGTARAILLSRFGASSFRPSVATLRCAVSQYRLWMGVRTSATTTVVTAVAAPSPSCSGGHDRLLCTLLKRE